ncbi:MAG: LarC family nickel insertion protein [Candidatus Omnitrophota bacterium]|nr:LarC family nickel insertion protein [Candidatus Omnitrophota bacterium]
MRSIYFHLAGGAAGDMLLSALIGLGCPFSYLKKEFKKLRLGFSIHLKKVKVGHKSFNKIFFEGQINLSYREIIKVIAASGLNSKVKDKSLQAYESIFDVEKKIHKIKQNNFHFRHLGEIDAILEICGFFIALKYLKVDKIYVSSFPLDLPAPATLELLKGKKIKAVNFGYETITPTAAVLLKDAIQTEDVFIFSKSSIACGDCGEKDYLIAYLIDRSPSTINHPLAIEQDKIIKLEANIDDMNPQIFESLFDFLYKNGAKEIYVEQVIMKKSRPAFVLNVLCSPVDFTKVRDIVFSHTSTFGIRYQEYFRDKLKYKFVYKNTKFGKVKFRVSEPPFKKETPEYQDCLRLAKKFKKPILEIYRNIK